MIAGFVRRVCVAIAFLLLAAPASWAQNGGSISGAVVDPLGARVSGATLKLMLAGKEVKSGTSDARATSRSMDWPKAGIRSKPARPASRRARPIRCSSAAAARVTVDVALPIGPLEQSVSVTAAATDVLPSQIGAPVTVLDAKTLDALGKPDVLEGAASRARRRRWSRPAARGGVTSIFIRGGNSNFNKVLIDGIPANDIGGGVDLSQFSLAGVERIEVLRDAEQRRSPAPTRWPASSASRRARPAPDSRGARSRSTAAISARITSRGRLAAPCGASTTSASSPISAPTTTCRTTSTATRPTPAGSAPRSATAPT